MEFTPPPHPANRSKIHLHVEKLSQKTNWKLAEDPIQSELQELVG